MSGRRTTATTVSGCKRSVPLWRILLILGASFGTSPLVSVKGFAPLDVALVSIRRTATGNNYPASLSRRTHGPDHHRHRVTNSEKPISCRQHMTSSMDDDCQEDTKPPKKKKRCKTNVNSTAAVVETTDTLASNNEHVVDFESRITQLEQIVSRQEVLIQKLRKECTDLTEAAVAFGRVVDLLRQAGLENTPAKTLLNVSKSLKTTNDNIADNNTDDISTTTDDDQTPKGNYEYFDDSEIFGRAPSSVIDAADAAGAAILAGMLGGKQRMLVDVRDAELSRDPETLVQFVELAILPVAAGLEGLRTARNRVKIVFPTVSQLLQYRRTMALAAPEVVALSTLGFDPVEKQDQLVVLIAPSPDDGEGLAAMNELLCPTDGMTEQISQPLVVVNHHMVPVSGPAKDFEVAYHLRLLSVQYMSGENKSDYLEAYERHKRVLQEEAGEDVTDLEADAEDDDEALEAAMKHAHEIGMNQGVTRAMVIRSYPK